MPHAPANRPAFHVVRGDPGPRWVPRPVIADLGRHPFRPGETPSLVTLALDAGTRARVETGARTSSVPHPLWVRIAVEATRCVAEAAALLGWPTARVVAVCDEAASRAATRRADAVVPLVAATLGGYADLLATGAAPGRLGDDVLVRVSDEMHGAWAAAAAAALQALDAWAAAAIAAAPAACVDYESAAARESRTLAEWVYASSLSAAASSTA